MFDDFLFGRKSKKQRQREQLEENKARGRAAENMFVMQATMQGKQVKRTGRGHDFIEREKDIFGRTIRSQKIEVKSSKTAPLSELQKENVKKKRVKVVRIEPYF